MYREINFNRKSIGNFNKEIGVFLSGTCHVYGNIFLFAGSSRVRYMNHMIPFWNHWGRKAYSGDPVYDPILEFMRGARLFSMCSHPIFKGF